MNQKERERRILVAQIGRGNYQILDYAKADEKQKGVHGTRCTYGYSFEAVYDQFRQDVKLEKEDVSEDIILLVGTATSFWGSLCAYYMDQEKALESRRYPITEQTKDAVQKQLMWKDGTCIAADELQLEEKEIYQNPTSGKPPVVIGNILIKHMEQQSYVDSISPLWGETSGEAPAGYARLKDEDRQLELVVPVSEQGSRYGLVTRNYIMASPLTYQAGYGDYRYVSITATREVK